MAKLILSNLDLALNQLLNQVIEKVGALPETKTKGRVVYLTTDEKFYGANGTVWIDLTQNLAAADILTMLKTVDIDESGLNANTLQGNAAAAFATAGHSHGSDYVAVSTKGQANGVASLDGGGKVPINQLPSAIMEYKGVYDATANSPVLKDTAIKAAKVIQDLTFTADTAGAAGNAITIAYVTGGTAGSEEVTTSLVNKTISVKIDDTPSTGSTATQIKAAIDGNTDAATLVDITVSGTGATVQALQSATALLLGQDQASTGDVYRVGTLGTINLGSGAIEFAVGDYAIYNGTTWEKSDTTDAVASVNSKTGIVVLNTDDISDATRTNKFTTAADITKLSLISAGANKTEVSATNGNIKVDGNQVTVYTHPTVKFAAPMGDAAATSFVLEHNLNTRDVGIIIRQTDSPYSVVDTEVEMTSVNSVTVKFATAPSTDQYRAVIFS
jgi:hypothetical protein